MGRGKSWEGRQFLPSEAAKRVERATDANSIAKSHLTVNGMIVRVGRAVYEFA
jgi:hypothetical protein